jgi:hypothetical protein
MSDLSITASAVQPGTGSTIVHGTAGAAVTAGQPVYKDANDSDKWKPADADASEAQAAAEGIAANSAADEQPLAIVKRGPLVTGATTVKGTVYVLSDNAGGICPAADLSSGSYTTILAVAADNAGTLNIHIHASGVQW